MRFINPNVKILILPLLLIPLFIILFLIVVQSGYQRVSMQIEELRKIEANEKVLEGKLAILRKVQAEVLEKTNISVLALPEKNPAALVISLVKTYAEEKSIPLNKITMVGGGGAIEEIKDSRLEIEAESAEGVLSIIDFIRSLAGSIPLTTSAGIKVSSSETKTLFELESLIYWSSFPTQLPALSEPIKDLSQKENELLEEISGFSKPSFFVLEPDQPTEERENPFF